jgi:1,4-dihydroxy-2-naphthoyl-CoA synthase
MFSRRAFSMHDWQEHHPQLEDQIDCTVRGAVLQICINRPAKRNGFTPKMFREWARLTPDAISALNCA